MTRESGRGRDLAERSYFVLCGALGRLLRSGRYSTTRIVPADGGLRVRKRRLFYAPLLVRMGGPLVRVLDTGVQVLPERSWVERERALYRSLYGAAICTDVDGTLVLPRLSGNPLAALLQDHELAASDRERAIRLAVVALAELHHQGFTHGDAMAENVLVDLPAGAAHWIDFETVHDQERPASWRRADDVRALLATCLLRTRPEDLPRTLHLILDVYPDEDTTRPLAASFASVLRRPLTFHLAQAGLPFREFRRIGRLLAERAGGQASALPTRPR